MSAVRVRLIMPLALVGAISALPVAAVPADTSDMPVTTASPEARQLFEQARDRFENIENAEAVPLFDQAIGKDPAFALAYAYRALSSGGYMQYREDIDKAVALADKVSPGERHLIMAMKAQADGDPAAQKNHLDQLAALFPKDKRVHVLLGNYAGFVLADNKEALAHYREAASLDPDFAAAYNLIGYAESSLRNYPAAEDAFRKYIALRPNRPNPHDSYGELLMKLGRYDESIAQYRKALEIEPSFTLALRGVGDNYTFKGAFAEARKAYERQFQEASTPNVRMQALMSITASHVHEGNTNEALTTLVRARELAEKAQLTPAIVGTHHDAAFILSEAGRHDEALAHLEQATRAREASSMPANLKAQGRVGDRLARTMVRAGQKQFDAARADLQEAGSALASLQHPPLQRFHHMAVGIVALEQGEHKEALTHLEQADADNPYVMYQKAVAHEKLGHADQAMTLFKEVAGWNANSLDYAFVRSRALRKMGKT